MPSFAHQLLVELLRNRSDLVRELLRACKGRRGISALNDETIDEIITELSQLSPEAASADLSEVTSTEYRADYVSVLRKRGKPRLVAIVEIQLGHDSDKQWSWPMYWASAHARYKCPVVLLVIAPRAQIARRARALIQKLPARFPCSVLSYADMPRILDEKSALRMPELAVISALAHPRMSTAKAALSSLRSLPKDQRDLYSDVIFSALPEPARRKLEAQMIEGYTFQSTTFRKIAAKKQRAARKKGLERGREQGLQEGLRAGRQNGHREGLQAAALKLARAKLAHVSPQQEATIRALSNEPQLTSLIVSLGNAADAEQARATLTKVAARAARASRAVPSRRPLR